MTQPSYLKALKAHARVQMGDDAQIEATLGALSTESDRGAIILAATGVEDMLEHAIRLKMPGIQNHPSLYTEIFGQEGSCNTFSKKAILAQALGIIQAPQRKDIDLMREIRNACAHSRLPLDLTMSVLSDAVKASIGPNFLAKLKNQEPATLRGAFIVKSSILQQSIQLGRDISIEESFVRSKRHAEAREAAKNATSPQKSTP